MIRKECPHCLTRVIPSKEGACPSCLKNVEDSVPATEGLTEVVVTAGEGLPDCCIRCGSHTRRREKFRHSRHAHRSQAEDNWGVVASSLLVFLRPVAVLAKLFSSHSDANSTRQVTNIDVPLCSECSGSYVFAPKHIDPDAATIAFVACTRFAEHLAETRETRRDATAV
jgi:hypothetical protein